MLKVKLRQEAKVKEVPQKPKWQRRRKKKLRESLGAQVKS